MRDALIFAVIFALLPVCVARPFVGVLVYSWLGYMNPHRLTWGAAYDFPFAQIVAIATLIGIVTRFSELKKQGTFPWLRESKLTLLLFVLFSVTSLFTLVPGEAFTDWFHLFKVMLFTFLTMLVVNDLKKLRIMLLVIAGSLGFYGFKGGAHAIASGGNSMLFGPGGMIGDNTALGLALVMVAPLIYFLYKSETNRWMRLGLLCAFPLNLAAIIFTYSRGAWLGMVGILFFIFLDLKTKTRIALVALALVIGPATLLMLPDKFYQRLDTLENYEEDSSANKRFGAWAAAWDVALARPITGGGFGIIDEPDIARRFSPEFSEKDIGVHSIYFEVLAENGFIAFGVFAALLFGAILRLRRLARAQKKLGNVDVERYARMLMVSLTGYAISGAFLEFAHFDLFYQLVACAAVLFNIAAQRPERVRETARIRESISRIGEPVRE